MTAPSTCVTLSRRSFLVASGGFTIGLTLPGTGAALAAEAATTFQPNAWVTIDAEGLVTIMSPSAEMGQGAMTGVPMCLANELDADWAKVRVQQAPTVPAVFGNPLASMQMTTVADFSIQGYFDKVRLIGAQTRRLLMTEAAARWQVPLADLDTEPGQVVHPASGRRLGYGDLARSARVPDKLPELGAADLRPRSQWRIIGRDVTRVDLPDKVNGRAVFGIDVRHEGLLYAAMLYPPVRQEKPLQVDDGAALAVPGVLRVVSLPRGVGVIATSVEASRAAKALLKVQWSSDSRHRGYDSQATIAAYRQVAADLPRSGVTMLAQGDATARLGTAERVLTREFHSEHVAHATMEPPNATARFEDGRVTLWVPTQSPSHVLGAASRALGIAADRVTVHSTYLGGGFGRLSDDSDPVQDVVLLAREVPGRPLKLVRSREDEFLNDVYRPLAAQRIDAAIDAQGLIVAWRHRVVSPSHFARAVPYLMKKYEGKDIVTGLVEHPYGWPDNLVQFVRDEGGWDVGPWRGVAAGYTSFAVESVVDEVAAQQKVDPVAYRLRLLQNNPRGLAVLRRVAEMAQWQRPRPRGRMLGVAMAMMSKSTAAQVVEVSIAPGPQPAVRVHRVWTAIDAGVVVHPDAVKAQIEGGTVMGIGPALFERVQVRGGQPQASNFHNYPIPRMSQAPESIEVELLHTDNPPGGVGEIGVTMVAPAIACAVARLTGQRHRSLPITLRA